MPFRRFFDRGARRSTEEGDRDEPEADEQAIEPEAERESEVLIAEEEALPEDAPETDWRARAAAVLPTGGSTGSKRPEALWGDASASAPTHFVQSAGCRVVDARGATYIDCTMSLGAVALGYAEERVRTAVMEAVAGGNVSALADVREVEVAERLCQHIPCAENVQFLKTGADAVSAAVRLARAYTGRDEVIGCGYFGWHDWASDAAGVPQAVRSLFHTVPFDDVDALQSIARDVGGRLAAIVIEPVIERLPSREWVQAARDLATTLGAVLVFDEMKTGFRLHTGGYQALADITPDLAAFGKAMANGFPLAAVVGQRDIMAAARRTWISSTLAGESTGVAAAGAVLDWHEGAEICEALASTGRAIREAVAAAVAASGIDGVEVVGLDQMWLLRFDERSRETRFLELAARHGVLFKRGAYNYACIAHDDDAITAIEHAASAALVELLEEERVER
ncbi:MAG TPA: aminotransferase class III-fold pyridoxal phosphate-dependent enzyme [Gemmatimonadaceae bacterium]|nr:aminotransferase class III-fold pyridoxal phosphate-dependent enzyme [Gemmatimonadaceae bacterium]